MKTTREIHDLYKLLIRTASNNTRSQEWIKENILNRCNDEWYDNDDFIEGYSLMIKLVEQLDNNTDNSNSYLLELQGWFLKKIRPFKKRNIGGLVKYKMVARK